MANLANNQALRRPRRGLARRASDPASTGVVRDPERPASHGRRYTPPYDVCGRVDHAPNIGIVREHFRPRASLHSHSHGHAKCAPNSKPALADNQAG
eukprot:1216707-Rhodomonas_salina.2